MKNKSLATIWQLPVHDGPITDFTIGIDTPEKMIEKLNERQWPVYKIKVGGPDDLHILSLLRTKTNAPFRVDANAGWSLEEALHLLPLLEKGDIINVKVGGSKWEYRDTQILTIAQFVSKV